MEGAHLCYGVEFEDDFNGFPWQDFGDGGDFDEWWYHVNNPRGEEYPYESSGFFYKRDKTHADIQAWLDAVHNFNKDHPAPVEVVEMGYGKVLAVPGSRVSVMNGAVPIHDDRILVRKVTEGEVHKLLAFCEEYGLLMDASEPAWQLVATRERGT